MADETCGSGNLAILVALAILAQIALKERVARLIFTSERSYRVNATQPVVKQRSFACRMVIIRRNCSFGPT